MLSRRLLAHFAATMLIGTATAWVAGALGPAFAASSPTAPATMPKTLTGPYQLYCPGTLMGNLVLHAHTKASLSGPGPGPSFRVTNLQVRVTLTQSLAAELAILSPIAGTATAVLRLVGATPSSRPLKVPFVIVIPKLVPAAGVSFSVPSKAPSYGPFAATSKAIAVEMSSTISMSLSFRTGGRPLKIPLNCTAFPNGTPDFNPKLPWSGTAEPPLSRAISPVVGLFLG